MQTIKANKKSINFLVTALKKGAVLVLPTDTVYGLVCDAKNETAVKKIFKIKKRNKLKPLAVFVKDIKQAKKFAIIDKKQEFLLKDSWPGATTFILKAKKGLSSLVYKKGTIGLRIPNYKLINLIFKKFKNPLAQTSANISGFPATTKIDKVIKQFIGFKIQPDAIINFGDLPTNKPSVIIDNKNHKIKKIRKA
jgi:L-threonylcarbamoyladenylate synthase